MSTQIKGRSLELAIMRASREYRKNRINVVLVRQFPQVSVGGGGVQWTGSAPIDMIGSFEGVALAIEAKEVSGQSLPCSRLRDDQRKLFALFHSAGASCFLIVDFMSLGECYAVPWAAVATFLEAPWRQSWSIAWCRSVGLLLREAYRNEPAKRCVMFLDGVEHPEIALAREQVENERAQFEAKADTETAEPLPVTAAPAQMSDEDRQLRILDAMRAGLENAQKREARPKRKWPRR